MTETKIGWWKVNFELTLEGEEVRFDDLSDNTREHIIQCLKEGYIEGEIVEEIEDEDEEETDPCEWRKIIISRRLRQRRTI